ALELLAASPDGCTEAIMLAHGFPVPLLVDLCIAGLAIATPEQIVAGGRPAEVVRMKITEAGRKAIKPARPAGREWEKNILSSKRVQPAARGAGGGGGATTCWPVASLLAGSFRAAARPVGCRGLWAAVSAPTQ